MTRQKIELLVFLLLVLGNVSYARWQDVRPQIQDPVLLTGSIQLNGTLAGSDDSIRIVMCCNSANKLLWTAEELQSRLQSLNPAGMPFNSRICGNICTAMLCTDGRPMAVIWLGTWDCYAIRHKFQDGLNIEEPPQEEGYYIVAVDNNIFVTASTVRGLEYAITSLWQAVTIEADGHMQLERAIIRDYPAFPKRQVYDPIELSCTGWNHGIDPQITMARDILTLGRDLLLANKGNGIVHTGRPNEYEGASVNHSSSDTVMTSLRTRPLIDALGHRTRWQDMNLDWYEGISWNRNETGDSSRNTDMCYRAVQIQSRCEPDTTVAVVNDCVTMKVIPKPAALLRNPDFRGVWDNAGNPRTRCPNNWLKYPNDDNPNCFLLQGTVNDTDKYVNINVDTGDGGVGQTIKLQESFGAPSRQMLLTYKVRIDSANNLANIDSIDIKLDMSLNDCKNAVYCGSPSCTTEFKEPGYEPLRPDSSQCDISSWKLFRKDDFSVERLTIKPLTTNWVVDSVRFITYGAKSVNFTWNITNRNFGHIASVDLDSIRITDTDFYNIYGNLINGADFPYQWQLFRRSDSTFTNPLDSSSSNFSYTPMSGPRWQLQIHDTTISHHLADYRIKAKYWVQADWPQTITDSSGTIYELNRKAPLTSFLRTDRPGLFTDVMQHQMSAFKNEMATPNGVNIKGYFSNVNEIEFGGWMPGDCTQSVSKTTAQFMNAMCQALPDTSHRELILWGDPYDPFHNGMRFNRTNNPYKPVLGLLPESATGPIQGFSPQSHITFMQWRNPHDDIADFWRSHDFWRSVATNTEDTLQDVINELNVNDSIPPRNQQSDPRSDWQVIIRNDGLRRDTSLHARFTGGMLLYWPGNDWDSPLDFSAYYHWKSWMQWLWNPSTPQSVNRDFKRYYTRLETTASITVKAYTVDPPNGGFTSSISHVDLQYRIGMTGDWTTITQGKSSDSLYTFTISLPKTNYEGKNVVEYRTWAFSTFGNVGSIPSRGTMTSNPNAGERFYFTFEPIINGPIDDRKIELFTPAILTQDYVVKQGGSLVITPLPGYRHATMFVSDSAAIHLHPKAEFHVLGIDTSRVDFKLAEGATHWGGIKDSLAFVNISHVNFYSGKNSFEIQKAFKDSTTLSTHQVYFESPLVVTDSATISGNAKMGGCEVKTGAILTIEPGTELTFDEGARFVVEAGGKLIAKGTDTTQIVFKANTDSTSWLGIQFERGAVDTSILEHCVIQNAKAGVLTDKAIVQLTYCDISHCKTGILAQNGGTVLLNNCKVNENETGVTTANLATVYSKDTEISHNTGTGLLGFSRSTLYLENCQVDSNSGCGRAGGIGLYTGSSAFLKCTSVDYNQGTGISAYNGTLVLSSVDSVNAPNTNWRGNSIYGNHSPIGVPQICLKGRSGFSLYNGHSRIADSTTTSKLIAWEDQPTRDWWRDVYWGSTDTTQIKNRLPGSVVLSKIDSSWSSCENFVGVDSAPDSLMKAFLDPHNNEIAKSYSSARTGYKSILNSHYRWDWATGAADRLLALDLASSGSVDSTRIYLSSIADTTNDASLKRWLKNTISWCWAEKDSFAHADANLDSLYLMSAARLDKINAKVQKYMVAMRKLPTDTVLYTATQALSYIDTARTLLESVEVWNSQTITDSVVMYAPCSVEGAITIEQRGVLTILPLPGIPNPVVSFAPSAYLSVYGQYYGCYPPGKLYVRGTADQPVTLEWDTAGTYVWSNIFNVGYMDLKHAILRGGGFANDNENAVRVPVFRADSCAFYSFGEGLWMYGTDSCSYLKNSTIEGVGVPGGIYNGFGTALQVYDNTGPFTVENCDIRSSGEIGILTCYNLASLNIKNSRITGSGNCGIMSWEFTDLRMECTELSDNGDSLPELWVDGGLVDLVGSRCQFSDSTGSLIYAADPSYVDLEDGENSFSLYSQNGHYLQSGDTSSVWNITMNAWSPVEPTDSNFYNYLYPNRAAKWTVDSSLADFIACGSTETSTTNVLTMPDRSDNDENGGMLSVDGDNGQSAISRSAKSEISKSSKLDKQIVDRKNTSASKSVRKADARKLRQEELAKWREVKELTKTESKSVVMNANLKFLNDHPESELVPAALVSLAGLAHGDGKTLGISELLLKKAADLPFKKDRTLAKRLGYRVKADEGNPAAALAGLETMMETADSPQDSIRALVDAMGVHFFHKKSTSLQPRHDFVVCADTRALKHRVIELARLMNNPALIAAERGPIIPTKYMLYQNYPNPFNPTTEIKFDLPEAVKVELKVFNILGQEVTTLINDVKPAGAYRIFWDSKNGGGSSVASGVYVYQIKAGNFTSAKKMVLMR